MTKDTTQSIVKKNPLTPSKREELEKLKGKLKSAQEKLKLDPANKKLKEIVQNLKNMFKLERERGYKI